jgi:hypothetical protein
MDVSPSFSLNAPESIKSLFKKDPVSPKADDLLSFTSASFYMTILLLSRIGFGKAKPLFFFYGCLVFIFS